MKTLKKMSLGLVVGLTALSTTSFNQAKASTCNPDDYMASVCWSAGTYCPRGYVNADGRLLEIPDHTALFSLLGTNYGGNGRTNFAVPDLRGRTAIGTGQGPGIYHNVIEGMQIGYEQIYMNATDVAPHNHSISHVTANVTGVVEATTAIGDQASPENAVPAARSTGGKLAKRQPIYEGTPDTLMNPNIIEATGSLSPVTTGVAGSSTPNGIPNRPPQSGLTACINVEGSYPPRNN
ncbi:tail fiber protein [Terasakiella sp. SH-1]|uniref:phage tail protein n=1 Tax=Terasakiella sp. SH-1 TaxID=2560057 RepID=UPI00142F5C7D|nr:tail fiber protein [Terasakiella sp. SH-1]